MAYVSLYSLTDGQALDIFPYNATDLVRHWFLTLGDQLKTNIQRSILIKIQGGRLWVGPGRCQTRRPGVSWQFHSPVAIGRLWFGLEWKAFGQQTVEHGLMVTSSSSSVNLNEAIQATVNAAMIQMVMNNTGDHATVARYDIYCCWPLQLWLLICTWLSKFEVNNIHLCLQVRS